MEAKRIRNRHSGKNAQYIQQLILQREAKDLYVQELLKTHFPDWNQRFEKYMQTTKIKYDE